MLASLSGAFPSAQSPKQLSKANSCNLGLWSVKSGPQRGVDTGQSHLARKLPSPACSSGLSHCEASAFQMGSSKKDLLRSTPRSVQFSLLTCTDLWVSVSSQSGPPVTTFILECFPHSEQNPIFKAVSPCLQPWPSLPYLLFVSVWTHQESHGILPACLAVLMVSDSEVHPDNLHHCR